MTRRRMSHITACAVSPRCVIGASLAFLMRSLHCHIVPKLATCAYRRVSLATSSRTRISNQERSRSSPAFASRARPSKCSAKPSQPRARCAANVLPVSTFPAAPFWYDQQFECVSAGGVPVGKERHSCCQGVPGFLRLSEFNKTFNSNQRCQVRFRTRVSSDGTIGWVSAVSSNGTTLFEQLDDYKL